MSRFLFVQDHSAAKVRVYKTVAWKHGIYAYHAECADTFVTYAASQKYRRAWRWWIVDAESTEDAARCIALQSASHGVVDRVVQSSEQEPARIVAVGGVR